MHAAVCLAIAAVFLASCGNDDGADVRELPGDGDASASGASVSGSAAGSGSGSASGLSAAELDATTDNPLVDEALAAYADYVGEQVDVLVVATTTFTDAVRAGDLEAARAAYAPSREPWERIEPIAGLVESIDVAVDARVDDFAGTADPAFTGWHRLEYLLWVEGTTDGGAAFADQLDADLARLRTAMAELDLPPAAVALGAAELIEEVSEGKITGEEDRYSKTDLWDFSANVEGAQEVIRFLTPALQEADPTLLARIEAGFAELGGSLDELRDGDGFVLFCPEHNVFPSEQCTETTVTQGQIDTMKAQLAALSEDLALVPGTLGLS